MFSYPTSGHNDLRLSRPRDRLYNPDNIVRTELLLVDSIDRDELTYPNPSRYRIKLPKMYRNVIEFRLLSAQAPHDRPNVIAAASKIDVVLDGTTYEVTLPTGSYNYTTLAAMIEIELDAQTMGNWTVSVDTITHKLTFSHGTLVWSFLVTSGKNARTQVPPSGGAALPKIKNGWPTLGFPAGIAVDLLNIPAISFEESPAGADLSNPRYVLLSVKEPAVLTGRINSTMGTQGIFAKVIFGSSQTGDEDPAVFGPDQVECVPMQFTGKGIDIQTLELEWTLGCGEVYDWHDSNHALTFELIMGPGYNIPPTARGSERFS